MSGFTLPTSRPITQPYLAEFDDWDGDGTVDYPGGFYHSIGWDGHNGIDYGCQVGDPVEAVADGYVAFAAWSGNHWLLSGGGNAILVEHAEYQVQTEYLHLSQFAVSAGQWVTKGQTIGYAGKTGAATAPHLHLGMLPLTGINVNNRMRGRIDPTPYLYGGIAAQGTISTEETEVTPEQMATLVAEIQATNTVTQQIADVTRDVVREIPVKVWGYKNPKLGGGDAYQILRDAVANTTKLVADVAAVAAKAASTGATEEQIKQAVTEALAEGIKVNVTVEGTK